MAKTLADMTAEEREECVGMWCSIAGAGRLCVLLSTENDVANLGFSWDNEFTILSLRYKNVTPRFDLPRVWTPDGEPELAQALAEETYEYSFQVQNTIDMWEHPSCAGEPDRWWDTKSEAEEAALAAHEYGYPIRIVRRRVSPVEVISD